MKQQVTIAGRLSFGSYMEIVVIVAVAANTIERIIRVFSGGVFEDCAVTFLAGITFYIIVGLATFLVYVSNLLRKSSTLTIVKKKPESPKE